MRNLLKKTIASLFLMVLMIPQSHAETPLDDVELRLSIETQDLEYDFEDEGETIEKERKVIYQIEVIHHGQKTLENLTLVMDPPPYMEYLSNTTSFQVDQEPNWSSLQDVQGYSPLSVGYEIASLGAGQTLRFQAKFQVTVPENVVDDPLYTLAFASLTDLYSALPVFSNTVENEISGEPLGSLSVQVIPFPPAGKTVFSGSQIEYLYKLTNAGGAEIQDITLITFLPVGTNCLENCGTIKFQEALPPGETFTVSMRVQVKPGQQDLEAIENIGFDISTATLEKTKVLESILHPLNADLEIGTDAFNLFAEQVPNLVLNSPNGQPRPDEGDITETQYVIQYTGKGRPNTFQPGGGYGIYDSGDDIYHGYCSDYHYAHGKGSTVYAYNSAGGGCEEMMSCLLTADPIAFLISTQSPESKPSLIFADNSHFKSEVFSYGDAGSVNSFMQNGGLIKVPDYFTLSRAIEDGVMGEYQSTVETQGLHEDLWTYTYAGYEKDYDTCSCGEDCTHTDSYPVYTWQKTSTAPLTLEDDDDSHVSVYSSTAWLKTEGGHVATNHSIYNHDTPANEVILPYDKDAPYAFSNDYVHDPEPLLTPSDLYTPFGEMNADYFVFSGLQNQNFKSASGEAWEQEGTQFTFRNQGDPYTREVNARNYVEDLLVREKFGPVYEDELPQELTGTVDLQDNVVWHQTGDMHLGQEGGQNPVYFSGGQVRLYVEGDVYIHSDVFYEQGEAQGYAQSPLLRIEANNIYVDGIVQNLELLLLARENFYSGESFNQLRILGDVIAKVVHWERKPLLQLDPEEVNQPSEYLIEDLRKYVIPVPGDTELPDEYEVWRQVNPETGQVLDAY